MAFELVTMSVHKGAPSNGKDLLQIHLKDGTRLVATDAWNEYPAYELVLHPRYLPAEVKEAHGQLVQQLKASGQRGANSLEARHFRDILPRELAIGDKQVTVIVRYGRRKEHLLVRFDSPVVKLVPSR